MRSIDELGDAPVRLVLLAWTALASATDPARARARVLEWRGRLNERGQTTAEYALVLLAAAAVAVVLIAWARSSGKLPAFFDGIIDKIIGSAD
jgi:Flp pilus assembly pilin Flp